MRYTILTYHGVLPQAEIKRLRPGEERRYVIAAEEFAVQVAYLREHRLNVLTFAELGRLLRNGAGAPERAVLLTFDDGLENNFRVAFPILAANGLRATFFLVTSRLGQPGYLTWEQAAEMQAAGMEIGSHTHTHADLGRLSPAAREVELGSAKRLIEERLSARALALALPDGRGDGVLTAESPHPFVCTSRWGYNTETSPPLALKRLPLRHGDKMSRFVAFSEVNCAYIRRCQASKALVHVAKAALGASFYKRLRQMVLR